MKALQVEYRETVSKGYPSYTNKTVGIVLTVAENEKADDVLAAAQAWVRRELGIEPTAELPF